MDPFQRLNKRLDFDQILRGILESDNVYFQPPPALRMSYPCIRYFLSDMNDVHANNRIYMHHDGYDVTVIDRNPDSQIPNKILDTFKRCRFDRSYTSDNLHHFVFRIYY